MAMKTEEQCRECGDNVIWVCLVANIFLVLFKGFIGVISGSLAVIADAVHSGADVLDSIIALIAIKIGKKPPDEDHPYGHGKSEFIGGAVIGVILAFGAAYIIVHAFDRLSGRGGPAAPPHWIALAAAIVSIITNELLFRHGTCAAKEMNSPAIEAEAWDNRADAISSIPVFIGVLGAQLGFPLLDPLAALLVGVFVGKMAYGLLISNLRGLMDRSLDSEQIDRIKQVALGVTGVKGLQDLKTRQMGRHHWVDLQVTVAAKTTLDQSNDISDEVRDTLLGKMRHLGGATVVTRTQPQRKQKDN